MRLAVDQHTREARRLLERLRDATSSATNSGRRAARAPISRTEAGIAAQRERVAALRAATCGLTDDRRPRRLLDARRLPGARRASGSSAATAGRTTSASAGSITCSSIGHERQHAGARHRGLLEHRRPAVEGHAARRVGQVRGGRQGDAARRTSALMAMAYGNVYVAQVAFGAKDAQTVKAFLEAEAYPGPSLIIAYSHCIAHGYDLAYGARAAEAGGGERALAALRDSIRAGAPPAKPPLAARLGAADRRPRRSTCATRRASAWSSRRCRNGSRHSLAQAREQHRPGSMAALFGARRKRPRRRRREDDGSVDALPRVQAAASADAGRVAAGRRPRHGPAARRRGRRRDRHALAVRGADHAETNWPVHDMRVARGVHRRGAVYFPRPGRVRARPGRYLEQSGASRRRSTCRSSRSLNGTTAGGWLSYARSDRGGRRRRARAEPLPRRDRSRETAADVEHAPARHRPQRQAAR